MTVIYQGQDGDERLIHTKTVTIIGYDALAQHLAQHLRKHPVRLLICGNAQEQAEAQASGLLVEHPHIAVQQADIIFLSVPDEDISDIYMAQVARGLRRDQMLIFKSAYAIRFGFIEPPPFVDVGLLAPRAITPFETPSLMPMRGLRCFIGVGQDASRNAWERLLSFAKAVGMLHEGALEVSFEQEAEMTLFIQQAVIPALHRVLLGATDILVKQGYPIEASLIDLYLGGKLTDYMQHSAQAGALHALNLSQKTAQYGTLSRAGRFQDVKFDRLMDSVLADICSGVFAKEWAKEYAEGGMRLEKLQKQHTAQELWELEEQTLEIFSDNF